MTSKRLGKCILIVEDDPDIRGMLNQLFEGEGFQVLQAENGKDALEVLRSSPKPDIILLDLLMPVMDGYGFRKVHETDYQLSSIPIVLMSAEGQLDIKQMKIGLALSVRKPIDIDTLLSVVAKAIKGS